VHVDSVRRLPTRLFVVDAGRDARALRQHYPDRTRYAIVRGAVRVRLTGDPQELFGWVATLHCEDINVPRQYLASFGRLRGYSRPAASVRVTVAFGARHEPWIQSVTAP
jgi:hypothetical protein